MSPYGQDHPGTPPPPRRRNRRKWLAAAWFAFLYVDVVIHALSIASVHVWGVTYTNAGGGLNVGVFVLVLSSLGHIGALVGLTLHAAAMLKEPWWRE